MITCMHTCRALEGEPYAAGMACADCPEDAPVCVADLCGKLCACVCVCLSE